MKLPKVENVAGIMKRRKYLVHCSSSMRPFYHKISLYNILFFQDYFKIINNRFNAISNHSKTIKSNYIRIISDHFNAISAHFKTKKYIGPAQ